MSTTTAGVLEIEVKALKAALGDVVATVEARNTVPILSNVLLTVTPTLLTIAATDLDVWVTRHVPIEAGRGFAFTAEASTLRKVVDKLPADAVCVLSLDGGNLSVVAGRSRFKLPTLPVEDFPQPPEVDWQAEFEMPALVLSGAFGQVAHAISTEEVRYYLNGVFVHAVEGELRFATTDGSRLARYRMPAPDGAGEIPDIIIPRKVVKLLDPLLGRHEGLIDVRVRVGRIAFEVGGTTVLAKLIDGSFPDYTRVIPTANELKLSIDREQLIGAIGRVVTVSADKTKSVRADFDRDRVVLTVQSAEKGQGVEELPCDWGGGPLTIGLNARFWLDTLSHMNADAIEARFGDAASPTLWSDGEQSPALFVIMPMRV